MSNLVRLVYVSTSTNPIAESRQTVHKDVGRILMQSRKNNPAKQIGGVLYFSNNYFFQCLEGEQEAVDKVYNKIKLDPRHDDLKVISVERVHERKFSDWSMKYVARQDKVTRLLVENGFKEFNPYMFNEGMTRKMLALFQDIKDETVNQNVFKPANDTKPTRSGFFSRLFGKLKAA